MASFAFSRMGSNRRPPTDPGAASGGDAGKDTTTSVAAIGHDDDSPTESMPVSQSPPAPRTLSGTVPRRARVLVVDDERMVGDSLRRVLSDEFAVTATTDPEQALTWILSGESFDVILCDVMMPVTNGVALRNRIDAISADQAARIVFVTGGIVIPEVQALLERVPNAWLEKPIDVEGLRELIRRRMRSLAWLPEAPAV